MAEVFITWEPKPVVLAEAFTRLAVALGDYSVPLRESVALVGAGIATVFAEQGPGWAPWSENYAKYARKHNKGILWQSGDLAGSVTNPDNYLVAQNAMFWTGAAAPWYWLFHQDGTSKMPAREFLTISEATEQGIVMIFDRWIARMVEET